MKLSRLLLLIAITTNILCMSGCSMTQSGIDDEIYNRISSYATVCVNEYSTSPDKLDMVDIQYLTSDDMENLYISDYDIEFYYTIMPDLNITFEMCPMCPDTSIFDVWYGRDIHGNHVGFLSLSSYIDDTSKAPYVVASPSDYIVPILAPIPDHLKEYLELWFRVGYMGAKYAIDWGEYESFANVSLHSFLTDEYNTAEDEFFVNGKSVDNLISTFGNIEMLQGYYDSIKDIANDNDEIAMQYLIDKYVPTAMIYDAKFYTDQGVRLTDIVSEDKYAMYDNNRFYNRIIGFNSKNIKTAPTICNLSKMNSINIYYTTEDTIFVNDTDNSYKIIARTPSSDWSIDDSVSSSTMYLAPMNKLYGFEATYKDKFVSQYNEDIFDCPAGSLVEIVNLSDEQIRMHSILPYMTVFSDDIVGENLTAVYDGMIYYNTSDTPVQITRTEKIEKMEMISEDTTLKLKKTYPVKTRTVDAHDLIYLGQGDYIIQ